MLRSLKTKATRENTSRSRKTAAKSSLNIVALGSSRMDLKLTIVHTDKKRITGPQSKRGRPYPLHSGQFRIPFELVEPKPGFQSIVDSGRGVAEPASNECGRQISEIGFHRLSRIAVQSLFYSACVILSQVSSNRDRYLRRRSASFALALRVRELLKSRRPASDSERQRRQAATTCSS